MSVLHLGDSTRMAPVRLVYSPFDAGQSSLTEKHRWPANRPIGPQSGGASENKSFIIWRPIIEGLSGVDTPDELARLKTVQDSTPG